MMFSKAIAGGLGAALAKIVATAIKHFIPEMDSQAVEFAIYSIVTTVAVYAAPANAPAAQKAP